MLRKNSKQDTYIQEDLTLCYLSYSIFCNFWTRFQSWKIKLLIIEQNYDFPLGTYMYIHERQSKPSWLFFLFPEMGRDTPSPEEEDCEIDCQGPAENYRKRGMDKIIISYREIQRTSESNNKVLIASFLMV